jgi:hypothetical protein
MPKRGQTRPDRGQSGVRGPDPRPGPNVLRKLPGIPECQIYPDQQVYTSTTEDNVPRNGFALLADTEQRRIPIKLRKATMHHDATLERR